MRNFPIDPHYKNRVYRHDVTKVGDFYNVYRHDVTKVGDFYNGGLWGNLCLLSDQAEILFLVIQITLAHIMKVSARNNK